MRRALSNHTAHACAWAALLALAFFWPRWQANAIIWTGDWFTLNMPYRVATWDALRHGRLPEWMPQVFGGYPLVSNPEPGTFYLGNILLSLLPCYPGQSAVLDLYVIMHAALAAAGGAFLARAFRFDRVPSVLTGIICALNAFFPNHDGHVAMVQSLAVGLWLMGAVVRCILRDKTSWATLSGLLLAQLILVGHPQMTILMTYATALAATLLAVHRAASKRSAKPLTNAIRHAILAGAIGLLGAAVQIMPLATFVQHTARNELSLENALLFSLPLRCAPLLWFPWLGMWPAWKLPESERWQMFTPQWIPDGHYEWLLPVGSMALALALLSLLSRPRSTRRWFLAISVALLIIASFGAEGGLYPKLYQWLPAFRQMRVPPRLLSVAWIGLALLAGHGLQIFSEQRRRSLFAAVGALTFAYVTFGAIGLIRSNAVASSILAIAPPGSSDKLALIVSSVRWQSALLLGLGGALAVTTTILALRPNSFGVARAILLLATYAELFALLGHRTINTSHGNVDLRRLAFFRLLDKQAGRVAFSSGSDPANAWVPDMAPNVAMAYRLQMVDGYNALFLLPHIALPTRTAYRAIYPNEAVLDLWNVSTVAFREVSWHTLARPGHAPLDIPSIPPRPLPAATGAVLRWSLPTTASVPQRLTLLTSVSGPGQPGDAPVWMAFENRDGIVQPRPLRIGFETTFASSPADSPDCITLPLDKGSSTFRAYTTEVPNATSAIRLIRTAADVTAIHCALLVWEYADGSRISVPPWSEGSQAELAAKSIPDMAFAKRRPPGEAWLATRATFQETSPVATMAATYSDFAPATERPLLLEPAAQAYHVSTVDPRAFTGAVRQRTSRHATQARYNVQCDQPAWLFISRAWYPGWTAEINGKPVPVFRAFGAFQAVPVPAGDSDVRLTFRTPGLRAGLVLSSLATAMALIGFIVAVRRERTSHSC